MAWMPCPRLRDLLVLQRHGEERGVLSNVSQYTSIPESNTYMHSEASVAVHMACRIYLW